MSQTDTPRKSLVSRLQHVEQPANQDTPSPRRRSVLTPLSAIRKLANQTKTLVVYMSFETEGQLERILSEISPFSSPIGLTNLLDMMYCEMRKSAEFFDRARTQIASIDMPPRDKKTSILMKVGIDNFYQKQFNQSSLGATSRLTQWIASDWDWIQPKLTYRGLNESAPKSDKTTD
jgi:hypothetical protein